MARNHIQIDATPEEVFAVLADANRYADWVYGAHESRDGEGTWPDDGSSLEHRTAGAIRDTTVVVESDAPRRLVLRANLRRLGAYEIVLVLAPSGGGTRVTMDESPAEGVVAALENPVNDAVLAGRNFLSLRRLKELAEA